MNIKSAMLAMLVLIVAIIIGVIFSFIIRELLRAMVKKLNIPVPKNKEDKKNWMEITEDLISVAILAIALLLAKPFVVNFMESLTQ